jgi:XTP/dITP diphosphohydrolase
MVDNQRMKKYLLATSNKGKIIEIRECLAGLDVELLAPDDLDDVPSAPHETEDTFEGNAVQKAKHYFEATGIPCIADDSGILVEVLSEELGIHTRRWGAGPEANDKEWITYFLDRMKEEGNKRARFTCVIALIEEDGALHTFEGHCDGEITEKLEADYLPGLPISACFRPDGCDKVFSALTVDQKNSVSHRGRAVKMLKDYISNS